MKGDIAERKVWPVKVFPEAQKNLSYSFVSVLLHVFRCPQSSNVLACKNSEYFRACSENDWVDMISLL